MKSMTQAEKIEQIKQEASRIMHLHYYENDVERIVETFAPEISWIGAGENQYALGRDQVSQVFYQFRGAIPKCNIWDEHYDVTEIGTNLYTCTGVMWVATDPSVKMFLQVHQRVTFLFQWTMEKIFCLHIHNSNPYMEMMEDELFPEKIGQQSYAYVQEMVHKLEAQMQQKNKQMEMIMASVAGGLVMCRNDAAYSYVYVSEEAAQLFGYTVNEFLEISGGSALAMVYEGDRERILKGLEEELKKKDESYTRKYRVVCKDGSLKWILDSGRQYKNENGEVIINTLYLDITKSEQNAEEILQQKDLFASIFNTVPCGILRLKKIDEMYELISVNPAAIMLLGYQNQEIFLRDWHTGLADVVQEEDSQILLDSYKQMNQLGDSVDIEYRVCWPDGSIHWLKGNNTVVAVTDAYQVIQRIFFDVTESRRLEEQLQREQEMYRLAMESSSDIMYEYMVKEDTLTVYEPSLDAEGKSCVEKKVTNAYQQMFAERQTVHPDDKNLVLENICQGKGKTFECRMRTPDITDGSDYWWYQVTGKAIMREGTLYRVVGTFRNIHQEKITINAKKDELYMSQSALQAINGAYLSIYYVNLGENWSYGVRLPGMGTHVKYERQENVLQLLYQYIDTFVEQHDREKIYAFIDVEHLSQELRCENDNIGLEYCEVRDGQKRWLRMDFYMVKRTQAVVQHVIMTFRNVTERRKKELEQQQEQERARQALEEAYEAARNANLAKSEFLSRMSHDIRTPMNAVMGMTAIAEQNLSNPEKVQECLQKIKLSGELLLSLINEVLDMSKIESGNLKLNETPFQLEQMLQETVEMIRPELEERKQTFSLQMDAITHKTVEGDVVRIQQILLNLLSNAVKYTPEGGMIQVNVCELLTSAGDTGCYQFIVQDNGIGMSEAFRKRLFHPFERAEDSRVGKIQGTGLGLAITQNLVQMMNGTIEVESHLNQGSRFKVVLYLKLASEKQQEPITEAAAERHQPDVQWKVLLVEDNDLNREIAKELLEAKGFLVEEAVNGAEAVERFCSSQPGEYDLILMDIQMPVMNGYEATKRIRTLDRPDGAEIPIIALTANAFVDDIYMSKQWGMNAHLAKPLNMEHVMKVLYEWLIK